MFQPLFKICGLQVTESDRDRICLYFSLLFTCLLYIKELFVLFRYSILSFFIVGIYEAYIVLDAM